MKKIPIILVLILIIINFNSCSTYLSYFINKKNSYDFTYLNPINSLDTLGTIYAKTNNPPTEIDSISLIDIILIHKNKSKISFNNAEMKLKYKNNYFILNYDENFIINYMNSKIKDNTHKNNFLKLKNIENFNNSHNISDEYFKYEVYNYDNETLYKQIKFSFEPGLKEGDTLTLFTNGILTYENGTKILPDSINIIVPD